MEREKQRERRLREERERADKQRRKEEERRLQQRAEGNKQVLCSRLKCVCVWVNKII
jgi:hypothetical protein